MRLTFQLINQQYAKSIDVSFINSNIELETNCIYQLNNVIFSNSNGLFATKSWATTVLLISRNTTQLEMANIESLSTTWTPRIQIFENHANFSSLLAISNIECGIIKCKYLC